MPTNILGISAFYHDSAACLVQDGHITAAAQEERFTRLKHDPNFPARAMEFCLERGGISIEDLDYVAFYDKPRLKFNRIWETYLAFAPRGAVRFANSLPLWLTQKLHPKRTLDQALGGRYSKPYVYLEHHESHAASAFFPSPFDEAAVLTLDGVGEWSTTSLGMGRGNRLELICELRFPHSLGLLYTAFTYYCGFKANSGEYKLMGLAPYGEPKYADKIYAHLLDLKQDGSFRMDMDFFAYCYEDVMTSAKFDALFGGPARVPESRLSQREMDLAASVQVVTEEIMLRTARHAHKVTGSNNLVLAGGVALNCVGNGKVLREGPFENVWIQPAAGDAGGALGAALFVWHQLLDNERKPNGGDMQTATLLGPTFCADKTRAFLDAEGANYQEYDDEDALVERIADIIASQKVVGHMRGAMEFGPRALGNRSILGDPRSTEMQSVMNLKIKFRESFRPFAPSVLRDQVDQYFEMRPNEDSPYMLLVAPVKEEHRKQVGSDGVSGLDKLHQIRSTLPAITHVDYSARVQTVDERHGRYHKLIRKFHDKTGCPALINTSFNVRGEPIVCTPQDAYRCFMATGMDALVIDDFILLKEDQPEAAQHEIDEQLAKFELD
ncbi:MAG: hypothetical protein GKR94_25315 [Gammaproteobacteria bacterium]|nr:hypothetical protein [Gammaproteobacteria bacterium]